MGTCPECGQRYWITRGQGIDKGESAEMRGTRFLRRLRTIFLAGFGLLIFFAGVIIQLTLQTRNAFYTGAGVGSLIMLLAVMSFTLEKDDDA